MAQVRILPLRLWQLGVPAFAALVGVVAGVSPKFGLAAAIAVVYVVLVLSNLALGLALFLTLTFLESISVFSGLSLSKVAGGLLLLSWIALVATDRRESRLLARDHPVAVCAFVAMAAWASISAVWAEIPSASLDIAQRWILNLSMFPIVYAAVRERRHVRWVFALFIVGALISAAAGLAAGAPAAVADEGRLAGTGVNANELGELLIVAVVLAGSLGACRDLSVPARVVAFAGSGLSVVALLMTVSRGAIVGLLAALILAPLLIGARRRLTALMLIVLVAGCGVTYVFGAMPQVDRDRIVHPDTTGSGRTDLWKVGLRMVKDKPVLGVGAGNYANSTIHYLFEPGTIRRSDYIVDRPLVAHNVYLQVLAELGVVGLALFLGIIAFALRCVLRAARIFQWAGDRSMELLSRGLLIGLFGLLASAFFSTAVYSKQLWLLLALAVAIYALAREQRPRAA